MKILVTGGAGFIGSAVVRHIINNTTDSVINLDKLTYAGNLESLANVDKSDRYAFEQVDICDVAEPLRYYHNNVYGTMVLLQAMQATEVYRLVFSSSATVYGEPKQMPITETCPVGAHHSGLIGEDPNDIPNNLLPYIRQVAVSKLPQLQVYGVDYPTIKISCPTFKS